MLLLAALVCGCAMAASGAARAVTPGVGRLQFNAAPLNWTDAIKACRDFGGYLAVAQSQAEADEMLRIMALRGAEETHYGVHDIYNEGSYLTLLDQPLATVGYRQWAPNAPNASTQLNCARLTEQGLTVANCSESLPSVCQFPLWDSYTRIGEFGYYKLHTDIQKWHDAKEVCRQEGATMMVLRSQQEFDAVLETFGGDITHRYIYYGAHHMFSAYDFVTIYGEPVASSGYESWAPNEPGNFASGRRAMALGISALFPERGFLLSDETNLRPFVCKHELYW